MAHFDDLDLGAGWWFYFEMRATYDKTFKKEFISQIEELLLVGSSDVIVKNDQVKKRIPVRSVRR